MSTSLQYNSDAANNSFVSVAASQQLVTDASLSSFKTQMFLPSVQGNKSLIGPIFLQLESP